MDKTVCTNNEQCLCRATAELEEEVEKELKKADPKLEAALAVLKKVDKE